MGRAGPRPLLNALGLALLLAVLEGTSVLLLVPVLQLVGVDGGQGDVAGIAAGLRRWFAIAGVPLTIATALFPFVAVNVAVALLQRAQTQQRALLEHRLTHFLRCRLYRAMIDARWAYLARIRSASFSHALTTELNRVGASTQHFVALCTHTVLALIYIGLAFRISAGMTAAALAAGALLTAVLGYTIRSARRSGESLSRSTAELHSTVLEHLGLLKATKSIGAEDRNYDIFQQHSGRLMNVAVRTFAGFANVTAAFSIGSMMILGVVLYLAVTVVGLSGAGVLLLLFVFSRLVTRFSAIQQSLQVFLTGLPAHDAVLELTETARAAAETSGGIPTRLSLGSGIELKNVHFRYEQSPENAIDGVSLSLPSGRTTALVGPSGSGKTTVADLIMGLLAPASGQVLVNGQALSSTSLASWRNQIGYVAQDAVLFHDTIRANLLWAAPGASEAELWTALEQAAAASFVTRLPNGLDTEVGESGRRFSGGERQRLALAQTLLRRPALLVLDEATSALDTENERRIQSAINKLHGSTTILVITHRLSVARSADFIHVMREGAVVESGDWASFTSASENSLRLLLIGEM